MTKEEEFKNAYNAFMNLDARITKTLRLVAIDAIKKQIKKKPKSDGNLYVCPSCNVLLLNRRKHCEECGQKLDWSET